jgi:hypothetical protein
MKIKAAAGPRVSSLYTTTEAISKISVPTVNIMATVKMNTILQLAPKAAL